MPGISLFKIFTIFGTVSAWAAKALEDGRISLTEAVELAVAIAGLLGIPTDIAVPADEPNPGDPTLVADAGTGDPADAGPPASKPVIQE